jgi:hypothetical protein
VVLAVAAGGRGRRPLLPQLARDGGGQQRQGVAHGAGALRRLRPGLHGLGPVLPGRGQRRGPGRRLRRPDQRARRRRPRRLGVGRRRHLPVQPAILPGQAVRVPIESELKRHACHGSMCMSECLTMILHRRAYDPVAFKMWASRGVCPGIPAMQWLFQTLKGRGFRVFLVTGRDEETLGSSTAANLAAAGFSGYDRLIMRLVLRSLFCSPLLFGDEHPGSYLQRVDTADLTAWFFQEKRKIRVVGPLQK